jgi:hypothetical protein
MLPQVIAEPQLIAEKILAWILGSIRLANKQEIQLSLLCELHEPINDSKAHK